MAKSKSAACDGCGVAIWPDSRRPRPWLCVRCKYPDAAAAGPAPVWRLAAPSGVTTGIVLERCAACGVLPEIAATFPGDQAPRAIAWPHRDDCAALAHRAEETR